MALSKIQVDMGNIQTSIDLRPYLDENPIPKTSTESAWWVRVHVPHVLERNSNGERKSFVACITEEGSAMMPQAPSGKICYDWSPASDMRDFEVIHPFTSHEIRLARGQVIGVIVHEALQSYTKFYYDATEPLGVSSLPSPWIRSKEQREHLNNDLVLGLEVLLVQGPSGEKKSILKEGPRAPRNQIEGKVFLSFLPKSLEQYRHPEV